MLSNILPKEWEHSEIGNDSLNNEDITRTNYLRLMRHDSCSGTC